jgi:hypothetical protein
MQSDHAERRVYIEDPTDAATLLQPFVIRGWAIDPSGTTGTGIDAVRVFATLLAPEPSRTDLGSAEYGIARPELEEKYSHRFLHSGFELTARGLRPGNYILTAYARSADTGAYTVLGIRNVVVEPALRIHIDEPPHDALVRSPFAIWGWAIDLAACDGSGVDLVKVGLVRHPGDNTTPTFQGVATYPVARPHMGVEFGAHFTNSGFHIQVPLIGVGEYEIVVHARSKLAGEFSGTGPPRTIRVTE